LAAGLSLMPIKFVAEKRNESLSLIVIFFTKKKLFSTRPFCVSTHATTHGVNDEVYEMPSVGVTHRLICWYFCPFRYALDISVPSRFLFSHQSRERRVRFVSEICFFD
tara:strand:- start:8220 stop:8543 length:324 start_codon:yes stop_codon:yes gene_type:complete